MRGDHVLRASWLATTLAIVLAIGATGGVVSVAGSGRGDVAHAARLPSESRHPIREPSVIRPKKPAAKPVPELLVRVRAATPVRARPALGAHAIGVVPAGSKYYHVGLWAWIETTAKHGRWGRVSVPYTWPHRDGWISLRGLRRARTFVEVHIDLSSHRVSVTRFGKPLVGFRAGVGASYSPTPTGRYFVTDRIPFSPGSVLGSFAFGISGIQPRLPAGWSGGDQLAIHGTNEPWTIGRNASAGCVHVTEHALHELEPLLRLGTPIIIEK